MSSEDDDDDLNLLQITDGLAVQETHIDDDNEGTDKNQDSARKSLSFLSAEDNQTSVNEMDPATPLLMIDVKPYSGDKENGKTRGGKRKMSVEPNPNSIGGRLRQRRQSQA